MEKSALNIELLDDILFKECALQPALHFYVGFSGGQDSTVLLYLMHELRSHYQSLGQAMQLTILHVDHGLHQDSPRWGQHCQSICEVLELDFRQTQLMLKQQQKTSEQAARQGRYDWFTEQMVPDSVLVTAHHLQDRAETLLFNLMRGAGVSGLSSMRAMRTLNIQRNTVLVRPLLNVDKADIEHYAKSQRLSWIDDPSNEQIDYSRNYIRQKILPELTAFREDSLRNIVRAANLIQNASYTLDEVAELDLQTVTQKKYHPLDHSHALQLADINQFSSQRRQNLFRYWLTEIDAPLPDLKHMQQLENAFDNPPEPTAIYQYAGWQTRFFQGYCYVMPSLPTIESKALHWHDLSQAITVPVLNDTITATNKLVELQQQFDDAYIVIDFRHKGDSFTSVRGKTLSLKKWLQENAVPTWQRFSVPLLLIKHATGVCFVDVIDPQKQSEWYQCQ